MPLEIIRNDITKVNCDAIVNAANSSLLGGGGVDGAIHRAAGPELLKECRGLGGCPTGQAKITKAYRLPCRYVIHTVGPIWQGGSRHERELLVSCYRESLKLAAEYKCESVAFPLISSGIYGYPKEEALQVAVETISEFLLYHEMQVTIVVFDKAGFQVSKKLLSDVGEYIDQQYVDLHTDDFRRRLLNDGESVLINAPCPAPMQMSQPDILRETEEDFEKYALMSDSMVYQPAFSADYESRPFFDSDNLDDIIRKMDESFSQMLLRKIDESGITDVECYKKANISRKLFSKIRSDIHYKPKKATVLAFAIALELNLEETKDMLMKAGFALSHSSKFDIIIEFFIRQGIYDIYQINETLFVFDQILLGM